MADKHSMEIKGSKEKALFWSTLAFFAGFAAVSAYGPVVAILKKSMIMTPFMVGLLVAIPALTGSILRIPFGAMADKNGGKKPILVLLCLSTFGIAGMALTFYLNPVPQISQYYLFAFLGLLAGCGIAIFSVGVPAVSYWFPQKSQGTALAVYGGLANTAPGIFAALIPILVVAFGIPAAYTIWFLGLLIVIFLIAFFMHDAPSFQLKSKGKHADEELIKSFGQELIPSGKAVESLIHASSDNKTWILTFIYFVTFGGFIALTSWLPIYWSQFFGFQIVLAGVLTALFSLSTSFMRVVGGPLSDRYGGKNSLIAALLLIIAGTFIMSFVSTDSLALAIFGLIITAFGMGFGNASVFKLVPRFTPKNVGGSSGIVGGIGALGGFVIPLFLGNLGYNNSFLIFVVLSFVGLTLLFSSKEIRTITK
ncbi:MAG: MFS transporter [Candidatus Margulisiibacteriota bacterium]